MAEEEKLVKLTAIKFAELAQEKLGNQARHISDTTDKDEEIRTSIMWGLGATALIMETWHSLGNVVVRRGLELIVAGTYGWGKYNRGKNNDFQRSIGQNTADIISNAKKYEPKREDDLHMKIISDANKSVKAIDDKYADLADLKSKERGIFFMAGVGGATYVMPIVKAVSETVNFEELNPVLILGGWALSVYAGYKYGQNRLDQFKKEAAFMKIERDDLKANIDYAAQYGFATPKP